jgi:hypothetical protein
MDVQFVTPPPNYLWEPYVGDHTTAMVFELVWYPEDHAKDVHKWGSLALHADGVWSWGAWGGNLIATGRDLPSGEAATSILASEAILTALGLPVATTTCSPKYGVGPEQECRRAKLARLLLWATPEQMDEAEDFLRRLRSQQG